MNSHFLSWLPFFSFLLILKILVLFQVQPCSSNPEWYKTCGTTFSCGGITRIGYPFRGNGEPEYCGYPGLVLNCNPNKVTTIRIANMEYRVLGIDQTSQIMRIAREDLMEAPCPRDLFNTTLDYTLFDYATPYMNLTFLYDCPVVNATFLSCDSSTVYVLSGSQGPGSCNVSVIVPVIETVGLGGSVNITGLDKVLRVGLQVRWKVDGKACRDCTGSNGRCGYDSNSKQTTCYCPDPPYFSSDTCSAPTIAPSVPMGPTGSPQGLPRYKPTITMNNEAIALLCGLVGAMIVVLFVIICCIRRSKFSAKAMILWKKQKMINDQNIEEFIRNYGSLTPKCYSFMDIKKMTESFTDKLGQGGYGSVFKGKLSDGCLVAVKVLSETKGNGEEFINEVASIGKTSHVNVVTLLGFCFDGNQRALIYEFMPNGSLDKFIFNGGSSNTRCRLDWKTLDQIAVGIARGLEYLHRGCNTKIVHFDIKPHNILLDEDFCPKISDFGLAKLCPRKESVVSMQGARGTIGYIAPEVFCRNFGGVSHKSDVYSYGMMVLEMAGAKQNLEDAMARTSEIYFPDWIYERLELGEDPKLYGATKEEEVDIVRKMILVGLWCIQTNPSHRPSMSKVVEMFEGSLQSLQTPPKPYLFSPKRSAKDPSSPLSQSSETIEPTKSINQ